MKWIYGCNLDDVPVEQRWDVVSLRGNNKQTVLHEAHRSPEKLSRILSSLPSEQRLPALQLVDCWHIDAFQWAASHPQSIHAIAAQISSDDFFKACTQLDRAGFSTLYREIENNTCFVILLKYIAPERRLEALMQKGNYGLNILVCFAKANLKYVMDVLSLLPQNHLLTACQAILFLVKDPQQLRAILNKLPRQDFLSAVNTVGDSGWTLLQEHAHYPSRLKLLEELLQLLDQTDLLKALAICDENKRNTLHTTIFNPEALEFILNYALKPQLLPLLETENSMAYTALHVAARINAVSFKKLFSLYPTDQKERALLITNSKGESIFYFSIYLLESFNISIPFILAEKRFALLTESKRNLPSMLHLAVRTSFALFQAAFNAIPKEQQAKAVNIVDMEGNTLLHEATRIFACFEFLLNLVPKSQQEAAIQKRNQVGDSVLHAAAFYSQSFELVLKILSQPLIELQQPNAKGTTPLHLSALRVDSLRQSLRLLAPEKRAPALLHTDNSNHTLLHYASYRYATLLLLSQSVPSAVDILRFLLTLFRVENNHHASRVMLHHIFGEKRVLANHLFDKLIKHSDFESMRQERQTFFQEHPGFTFN